MQGRTVWLGKPSLSVLLEMIVLLQAGTGRWLTVSMARHERKPLCPQWTAEGRAKTRLAFGRVQEEQLMRRLAAS